ncbi:MAG TPA: glutaredoxin family protein [Actinophytocola sp.]|uniref:glutaredoxin family protein n=1 Tax=Actinophytocola sp. TaxID=1872138 RepID=UPI002DBB02C2|nr:glutaredoxin family protein [Actinophytocola sp.]HEU5474512.1 glutaredoxin family protein [Actinophytocola sp.]
MGGSENVVVFGAEWCGDCRQAKAWLRNNKVPFTDVDVERDAVARDRAIELAEGRTNIPVVVLPDGSVLIEPTDAELARRLLPNTI